MENGIPSRDLRNATSMAWWVHWDLSTEGLVRGW